MANLHFTLDKSAGKLLAQIAQEHLLCNLDPKKAIETFTMSLNDLPVEMAIKLLSGELVIEVEDDGVNVNVVSRNENKHSDYPKPDFVDWYLFQHKEIRRSGDRIRLGLEELQRSISIHRGSFDFEFNYQALGKFIIKNDITEIEDIIDSDPRVENMRRMFKLSDAYLRKTYKLFNVFDFLEHTYPQQINPFNGCVPGTRYPIINRIEMKLKTLIEYDYELIEATIREEDEEIKRHIEAAQDIEKELKTSFSLQI